MHTASTCAIAPAFSTVAAEDAHARACARARCTLARTPTMHGYASTTSIRILTSTTWSRSCVTRTASLPRHPVPAREPSHPEADEATGRAGARSRPARRLALDSSRDHRAQHLHRRFSRRDRGGIRGTARFPRSRAAGSRGPLDIAVDGATANALPIAFPRKSRSIGASDSRRPRRASAQPSWREPSAIARRSSWTDTKATGSAMSSRSLAARRTLRRSMERSWCAMTSGSYRSANSCRSLSRRRAEHDRTATLD